MRERAVCDSLSECTYYFARERERCVRERERESAVCVRERESAVCERERALCVRL